MTSKQLFVDMTGITQKYLKSRLRYNPINGAFYWVMPKSNRVKVGQEAGSINSNGYMGIRIDGKQHFAHRLAFLYMMGECPKDQVDHINRIKTDNRWINLRECTQSQNMCNVKKQSNNTSGYKGVSWNKKNQKWVVQIKGNKEREVVGFFDCKHKAAKAYNKRATELFGEFSHLN